jgi:hypothetical protein
MKKIFIALFVISAVLGACKKVSELTAPRMFRPVAEQALESDSNTIKASWLKINQAVAYELQVSRDTFRTVDVAMRTDTNMVAVKQLKYNQLYQVQVRAINKDTMLNSGWSNLGAIKTLSSILKVPGLEDITYNSVRVKWTTKGAPVTSVKIVKTVDSSLVVEQQLTAADRVNEFKVIGGLQPGVKYTILLLSGTDVRGYADFTSKEPFSGTIIDLTGITGRPSVLTDTLPLIPSGSTVLLKRGETYNVASGLGLNKTVIIMSVPDLLNTTQAKIFFTSNFSFAAGAAVDSIEFNDLFMYSDNYGSRYIFNNTNSANIGKLKFVNSRMEIFRGMVRLQSGAANIGTFIVDNCIVDSIGNYYVLNIAASSKVDNVSLTNSTFYKAECVVSSSQTSVSFNVNNCTFNETPLGSNARYFFDYGSLNVTGGLNITNCIFGRGKNSAGNFSIKGVRAGTATIISGTKNYRTTDYTSGGNDIPNIQTHNRSSIELWQDPYNGNFKIVDQLFPGKSSAGDPRWW